MEQNQSINNPNTNYYKESPEQRISKMCSNVPRNSLSRKRNDLTIDRKLKIIEDYVAETPINTILKKYNINQSHLSSIIRRRAAIMEDYNTYGRKNRKRIAKRTKYAPINEEVFRWLMSLNCHVSGSIIQNKAKMFAEQLKIPGFRASNGWLECFRKKYTTNNFKNSKSDGNNTYQTERNGKADGSQPQQNGNSQLSNSTTNGGVAENSNSFQNGYVTPVSNDSLVSSIHSKSSPICYRRPVQSSNCNRDVNNYSAMYQPSTGTAISPLINTPLSQSHLPASVVDPANPNGQMRNFPIKMESSMLYPTSSYHSISSDSLPLHHSYGSAHYGAYMQPIHSSAQQMHFSPYDNQNIPHNILHTPSPFEPKPMVYPLDQIIPSSRTCFDSAMHMKNLMGDMHEMVPGVATGNNFQHPSTMSGNIHTPTTMATVSWNESTPSFSPYSAEFNGAVGSNPSLSFVRPALPAESSSAMAYPYNSHVNRNNQPLHQNQQKDFY